MKNLFFILFFAVYNYAFTQTKPNIFLVSSEKIIGSSSLENKIYIDTDLDGQEDFIVDVNDSGKFSYKFTTSLVVGSKIKVWSFYEKRNLLLKKNRFKTEVESYLVKDVNTIADEYIDILEKESLIALEIRKLDAKNIQLRNTTLSYKARISNTFFQIPLVRFNLTDEDNKIGNINIFNSIGAGVGLNWGRMEITRDNSGQIINEEFSSTFGIHLGALFSADTAEDSKNIFAPTLNVSLLDFQVGIGYELGTISENQKRIFITLAYSIPLYKLVKKSYRVWAIDPIPYDSRKSAID
jgi:hypothetical protein